MKELVQDILPVGTYLQLPVMGTRDDGARVQIAVVWAHVDENGELRLAKGSEGEYEEGVVNRIEVALEAACKYVRVEHLKRVTEAVARARDEEVALVAVGDGPRCLLCGRAQHEGVCV